MLLQDIQFQARGGPLNHFWYQKFTNCSRQSIPYFSLTVNRMLKSFPKWGSRLYQYHKFNRSYLLYFSSLNLLIQHIFDDIFGKELYSSTHIDCIIWTFFLKHLCTSMLSFHLPHKGLSSQLSLFFQWLAHAP